MRVVLASLLIAALSADEHRLQTFTSASLKGTFAFGFSGLESGARLVSTGVMTLDGDGAVTGRAVIRRDGGGECKGAIRNSTYQVNPDGTGLFLLAFFGDVPCLSLVLPLNIAASSVDAFEFASGQGVYSGHATRQDAGPFSAASIAGTYAFGLNGLDGFTPTVATGVITLDGAGKVNGKATVKKDGGGVCTGTIRNSTYGVDANGTGFMLLAFFPEACGVSEVLPLSIAVFGSPRGFELASTESSLYVGTAKLQRPPG